MKRQVMPRVSNIYNTAVLKQAVNLSAQTHGCFMANHSNKKKAVFFFWGGDGSTTKTSIMINAETIFDTPTVCWSSRRATRKQQSRRDSFRMGKKRKFSEPLLGMNAKGQARRHYP